MLQQCDCPAQREGVITGERGRRRVSEAQAKYTRQRSAQSKEKHAGAVALRPPKKSPDWLNEQVRLA